jgi:PAS domain S-box-containing protein
MDRLRRNLLPYVVAFGATAAAVCARWLLNPLLDHRLPFITLYAAIAVAVWVGGWRPALVATVLGYLVTDLLFVETEPNSPLSLRGPGGIAGLLVYFVSALIVIGLGSGMRSARRRAEAAVKEALGRQKQLESEMAERRRTEGALRAKEAELELITSRTPLLLTRCDSQRRYVFVNRAYAEFLGRRPEEIIGRRIADLMGEEAAAAIAPYVDRVLRGDDVEFEMEIPYAHRGPTFMRASYTPDRDERGAVIGWVASLSDVTDRKQDEEAIKRRERLFRTLVRASSLSIWQYQPGAPPIQPIDEANIAWWREFTGQTEEQRRAEDGMGWLNAVHPADRDAARQNWRDILGASKTTSAEFRVRRNDGVWRWLVVRGVPFRDEQDGDTRVAGTIVDVTEQKEAELALRESEERFRLLADAAPVSIWISGTDKLRTWFNKSWLDFVGRSMEQELGYGWAESIHAGDLDRCLKVYVGSFDTRQPFAIEYRLRRHDGEYRWMLDHGIPGYGPAGEFAGYIGSCIDITDRKHSEEDLREADRRKDEFLATLAHELRNPLAPVQNAVEILRLKGPRTPEVQWARDVIDRQMQQMARLIDDLMDVSRITRNRLELRKERVDLGKVLRAAVETSQAVIDRSGQQLDFAPAREPIVLDADLMRLAQVFSNLLSNAAKFSDRGSRISLAAERQGAEAVVSVRDTGIGIPEEMLPHIFESFTQVDRSLERAHGGLGIGLMLVKRLLEMHGGSIEARSDGPGKGSEFIARLPISEGRARQASKADDTKAGEMLPKENPPSPAGFKRCRILVADDNRDAAASLSMMLEIMGYETRSAYDGLQALEAADQFRPAVALLDIGMPKTNGYDVARHIRQQPWGKDIVLMAVTGWGQEADKKRTIEAGFDHHLVKPVNPSVLAKLLVSLRPPPVDH